MPGRRRLALADDLLDLLADGLERDVQRLERLGGDALALVDQAEQDVLGADVVVVEHPRFFLGENHDASGAIREALEHVTVLRAEARFLSTSALGDHGTTSSPEVHRAPRSCPQRPLEPSIPAPLATPWNRPCESLYRSIFSFGRVSPSGLVPASATTEHERAARWDQKKSPVTGDAMPSSPWRLQLAGPACRTLAEGGPRVARGPQRR